jgi:hypothetical protein
MKEPLRSSETSILTHGVAFQKIPFFIILSTVTKISVEHEASSSGSENGRPRDTLQANEEIRLLRYDAM